MSWFRIDDKSAFHRKVVQAGNAAFGAWTRAGAWSSDHGTDGRIPADMLKLIESSKAVWKKLVTVGLMDDPNDGTGDLQIHDFLDWNPSAEESKAKSEARRQAGQRGGQNKAAARSKAVADTWQPPSNCYDGTSGLPDTPRKQTSAPLPLPLPLPLPIPEEIPLYPPSALPASEPPSPAPPAASPTKGPGETRARRGERCPSSASPDAPGWLQRHKLPALDDPQHGAEVARMLDWGSSVSGSRGIKLDWLATWRNWNRPSERQTGFANHAGGPSEDLPRSSNVVPPKGAVGGI